MKRTYLPKLLALLAGLGAFSLFPFWSALGLAFGIMGITLLLLSLPVLRPRSNFYGPSLSRGRKEEDAVALSFDDGPDPRYTPQVLEILEQEKIQAIFFVVGERAARYPELIRAIVSRGHLLGNHSYSHGPGFHFRLKNFYREEITRFDKTIQSIVGLRCRFFRPPQGFRTPLLSDVLKETRLVNIAWTSRGYDTVRKEKDRIFESVAKTLGPGSLILLHDGGGLGGLEDRQATLDVLPRIIHEGRQRGLHFQRLDRFFREAPYFEETTLSIQER